MACGLAPVSGQSVRQTEITFEESESWKTWTTGLDQWRHGRLDEAVMSFRGAVEKADSTDLGLPEYYQSLGKVLDELKRTAEAEEALTEALSISLQHNDNGSAQVAVARYFLAEHLLRAGKPSTAIEVTEPSVLGKSGAEGILHQVRALAFRALGIRDQARSEARMALDLALSPRQRKGFEETLAELLGPAV